MKFCKDCKHYQLKHTIALCYRTNLGLNPVSGERLYTFCNNERADLKTLIRDGELCGLNESQFFEVKESEDLDDLSTIPFGANHAN